MIEAVGWAAVSAVGDDYFLAATALVFVEGLVAEAPDHQAGQALWRSFALGACFSGNGTAIAAGANVAAIGIAKRAGQPISFWHFTKYGIVVTALSTGLAWVYVWLRYF